VVLVVSKRIHPSEETAERKNDPKQRSARRRVVDAAEHGTGRVRDLAGARPQRTDKRGDHNERTQTARGQDVDQEQQHGAERKDQRRERGGTRGTGEGAFELGCQVSLQQHGNHRAAST
jgi:hypothetical protein